MQHWSKFGLDWNRLGLQITHSIGNHPLHFLADRQFRTGSSFFPINMVRETPVGLVEVVATPIVGLLPFIHRRIAGRLRDVR